VAKEEEDAAGRPAFKPKSFVQPVQEGREKDKTRAFPRNTERANGGCFARYRQRVEKDGIDTSKKEGKKKGGVWIHREKNKFRLPYSANT